MRGGYMLSGLNAIAKTIDGSGFYEFQRQEFFNFLIDSDIGLDPRTHEKWLRVAIQKKLLQERKTPKGSYYKKGEKFNIFLGGRA